MFPRPRSDPLESSLVGQKPPARFATLIGLISSFIRCRDSEAESLKSQLDYLDHYMHYRNMPRRVQQRIRDFFLLVCSHVGVSQVSAVQQALPSFLLLSSTIPLLSA